MDEAVFLEDFGRGFGLDLGQNAELRHHEDRVNGEPGDPFGHEGVDQHQGRLELLQVHQSG